MCSLTIKKLLEEANSNLQFTKVSYLLSHFIHVTFSSAAQSCPTLCDPMDCSTPGLPVHHQLPEFTQTHVHRVGDAVQPSHPLSSSSPPAFNLSQHQGFFFFFPNESVLRIRLPKYWSFSLSVSPSNEYSGLISFRFDWFNLLAVQGTSERLPQTPHFISILVLQMRTLRLLVGY